MQNGVLVDNPSVGAHIVRLYVGQAAPGLPCRGAGVAQASLSAAIDGIHLPPDPRMGDSVVCP